MSLRVCLKTHTLAEVDAEVFQEQLSKTGDASKAIDVVIKQIQADYRLLAKSVRDEGGILPALTVESKPTPKPKKKVAKKKAKKVDELVVKDQERLADLDTKLTQEEQLEDDAPILTDEQNTKLNGWADAAIDEDVIEYAEYNPELIEEVSNRFEALPEPKGKPEFAEVAYAVVKEHRGDKESIIPDVETTLTQEEIQDRFSYKYIQSEEEARSELEESFGTSFSNIEFVEGKHTTGRNVQATYVDGNATIYVWYENVPKGDMAELILHEKGVHEILAKDPTLKMEWESVKARMEELLKAGNVEVTKARTQAINSFISKKERPPTSYSDMNIIKEETVAYLMNFGKNKGWFRRFVAQVKKTFKNFFSVDLQPDDLRILVSDLVQSQADAEIDTALEVATGPQGNIEIEEDYQPTQEELAKLGLDSEVVADPELVTDYHNTPDTNYMTQFDIVGKSVDTVKTVIDKIKVKGLGFIPTRPLMEMLDRILPEGVRVSDVANWYDKAEAAADVRIEALDEALVKPLQRYQRDDKSGYTKMVHMALRGSQLEKNMEDSVEFSTLSPTGQKLYTDLRQHYKAMANDKVVALRAYTNSLDISEDRRNEMLSIVSDLSRQLSTNKGYFPFNRFGAFKVEGLLPDGERYVSHHDTLRQANQAKARMQKDGGDFSVRKVTQYSASAKELMTSEAYETARRFVEDAGGNKAAEEALWQTFLEYSPQRALQKKVAARKSVMGMSSDMVRSLGLSVHRDIRFNERLKVKGEVEKQFTKVAKAIKDVEGDNFEHQELYDELKMREVVDLRSPWSKNITKFNFGYYLGFNPASALVNLTQNAIVAMPVLSADFGVRRTVVTMNKEFAHVVRNIRNTDKHFGYTGIYGQAMKSMMEDGTVNVTQAHMMTGINEGHTADPNPDGVGGLFTKGMAGMFHNAEIANRATTAMSAFRMMYEKNGDYQEALAYSKAKTFESQFDFSETGKSRYQRGDVGNVLLAMKSYPISMAVYMGQNFNRWVLDSKATPEEKRVAKVKFLGTMIATTTLGGAAALPLSGMIPELYNILFGDDEDDPEMLIREAVMSIAGEELGGIMLDGLVGHVTGLDVTSKVNLGFDMFARIQGGQSASDVLEAVTVGSFGPVGGMALNATRGMDMIGEGKMAQGLTTMMPAALRNVIKGAEQYRTGRSLTSKDTLIEEASTKDALLKALGFNSEEHAEYFRKSGAEWRKEDAMRAKRSKLLRDYSWAVEQGDAEAKREARRDIRNYNRGRPKSEWITQSTIKRAIKELRKKVRGIES